MIALELEKVLADKAKERQIEAGENYGVAQKVSQNFEQAIDDINERKAPQQAAKKLGTS